MSVYTSYVDRMKNTAQAIMDNTSNIVQPGRYYNSADGKYYSIPAEIINNPKALRNYDTQRISDAGGGLFGLSIGQPVSYERLKKDYELDTVSDKILDTVTNVATKVEDTVSNSVDIIGLIKENWQLAILGGLALVLLIKRL